MNMRRITPGTIPIAWNTDGIDRTPRPICRQAGISDHSTPHRKVAYLCFHHQHDRTSERDVLVIGSTFIDFTEDGIGLDGSFKLVGVGEVGSNAGGIFEVTLLGSIAQCDVVAGLEGILVDAHDCCLLETMVVRVVDP